MHFDLERAHRLFSNLLKRATNISHYVDNDCLRIVKPDGATRHLATPVLLASGREEPWHARLLTYHKLQPFSRAYVPHLDQAMRPIDEGRQSLEEQN